MISNYDYVETCNIIPNRCFAAIGQARSADKLLPPITKVWAGPDCEAKDDTKCAARQKKNCIELIRRPEETFDVKCLAKGGEIEQVTLEKFE